MRIHDRANVLPGRLAIRTSNRPACKIPASSIADIAFLLVVFFALIAHEPDRSNVTLPVSRVQVAAEDDAALVVVVYDSAETDRDAPVYKFSDGRTESRVVAGPGAIGDEALRLLAAKPDRQFRLKADGSTPCRVVGRVLDALSGAGAGEVVMVTTPQPEDEP